MWLFPALILSFFINGFTQFAGYGYCLLFFYLIFFALQYFTSKKIFYFINKIFLLYFALSVFTNNKIAFAQTVTVVAVCLAIFVSVYTVNFFVCKKNDKNSFFNFKKFSCFLELLFILSVSVFGVSSSISLQILNAALGDFLYQTAIVLITINLKKRFKKI